MKKIIATILSIINTPIMFILSFLGIWYALPGLSETTLGIILAGAFSESTLLLILIIGSVLFVLFSILSLMLGRDIKSKNRNFLIHTQTWLLMLGIMGLSIYTFIFSDELLYNNLIMTVTRKTNIVVFFGLLLIYHLIFSKLSAIINRKIQAYDTALEMNNAGRGSIIFINLLKLFEIMFPEILVLILICFCVDWSVSTYFIIILGSCLIPVIGNMISDLNIRNEIVRKERRAKDDLAKNIARNMRGD